MKTEPTIKKQQLLNKFHSTPPIVGDYVEVEYEFFGKKKFISCYIYEIIEDEFIGGGDKFRNNRTSCSTYKLASIIKKSDYHIGANPLNATLRDCQHLQLALESILFNFGFLDYKKPEYKFGDFIVKDCNLNPFVYLKSGEKFYYQRELVWQLEDKQALIDSIYNYNHCGSIVVVKRDYEQIETLYNNGETELYWHDVIDGKQRICTIVDFINNVFPDKYGNYWGDLSKTAQSFILSSQLFRYTELDGSVPQDKVLNQFLRINCFGVQQSNEHLSNIEHALLLVK